jgi:predicted transcriptional regulator
MPVDAPLDIRLEAAAAARLRELAAETGRPEAELAAEAVEAYAGYERWLRSDIEAALREADSGKFAAPEEVEAYFAKWR